MSSIACWLLVMIQLKLLLPWRYISGPSNTVEVIEGFIDKHFRGNGAYYNNTWLAKHPFVFPPGHKFRIASFVSEVRNALKPMKKFPINTNQKDHGTLYNIKYNPTYKLTYQLY